MTKAEAQEIVAQQSSHLMEYFEHIQIMVTWEENGETRAYYYGKGNWYARMGLAHEFIEKDKAQIHHHESNNP